MFINTPATSWKYTGPPVNPEVEAFHQRLPDYNETPLVDLPELAKELGIGRVVLKDESNRFGLPAFKVLGASWAVYRAVAQKCELPLTCSLDELSEAAREKDTKLVTNTAGNWGRAVARMAKYLQIPVTVFVPEEMHQTTRDNIANEGAKVVVIQGDYDSTVPITREEASKTGSLLVMDVSWEGYEEIPTWVTEGYSTMLKETDRQLQNMASNPATHTIASVGGGSWAHAVCVHYKSKNPTAAVVAVEPESAPCLEESLKNGKITILTVGRTIMNGMNCGTVCYTAWDTLRNGVDASVVVSDLEVHKDLQYLHSQGVKNGPCGAAPVSALKRLCKDEKLALGRDSVVVLFSTEGAREYVVPK
ncbi:tryptophan synthase beta subunit-like PLP-dependent enzyme [Amniculicola lignicola CBS 123094]|uniref:Tryptophan synthase beta subunit-like PLP-dependent enzyme n=1 Tax=Amniculicola lignicola CBS 123094 TaxID=1392246 RepID=A0A6A5WHY8_9PLEO|nr:tryptophan synthase beta subunit-like PLP-dependent enzyme [Amniculicola lignicola CBS 123094]